MTEHPIISVSELIAFSELLADTYHCSPEYTFDPVGLILPKQGEESEYAEEWDYDCTPRNVFTFAHTGCDGTHFSLLYDIISNVSDRPVVMTRPTAFGDENLIVGASLWEFLSLGFYVGYLDLEGLFIGHPDNEVIQQTFALVGGQSALVDVSPTILSRLTDLRVRFRLAPWPDLHGRLQQLNEAYLPLLRLRGHNQEA